MDTLAPTLIFSARGFKKEAKIFVSVSDPDTLYWIRNRIHRQKNLQEN